MDENFTIKISISLPKKLQKYGTIGKQAAPITLIKKTIIFKLYAQENIFRYLITLPINFKVDQYSQSLNFRYTSLIFISSRSFTYKHGPFIAVPASIILFLSAHYELFRRIGLQMCSLIMKSLKQDQDKQILMAKDESTENLTQTTFKQSRYRWVNFTIYMMAALVNSLPTQTFASINSIVSKNFHYDPIVVTLNVLFFPVFHPIFAFPCNWILDRFGMKIGCSVGSAILLAGVWMRTLIEDEQVFWCLFGSLLAAIGNIFILNSPSIMANNWFKPASIPAIISFAVLANLISVALGSSLPGFLVKDEKGDTEENIRQKVQSFLRIQAIVITVPIILLFILLRDKPEIPPSKSADNQRKNKENYTQLLKKLFKNKEYLKIMLIMTLSYGATTSYLANLDQSLSVVGYKNSGQITSQVLLSAMLAGLVSSFFFIKKVKETLQYKSIMALCLAGLSITFVALQLVLIRKPSDSWVFYLVGGCAGFFQIPITSLLMSYSSQVVYPLGQGSATGYLFAASQTFGFVIGLGSAAIIQSAHDEGSDTVDDSQIWKVYLLYGLHSLLFVLSLVATLWTKNILNRTKYEEGRIKPDEKETQEGFIFSST